MTKETKVRVHRKWESLTEFLAYAEGTSEHLTSNQRASRRSGDKSFTGVDKWSDVKPIAFNWPEGAAKVSKMRALVTVAKRKAVVVQARRNAPGRINMGRAIQGHPYAFQRIITTDEEVSGGGSQIIDVIFNMCVSGGVSTDTLIMRGAATLALVDALEASGKRVRVRMIMANGGYRSDRGIMLYEVVVKRPEQRLNLSTLAFAVAHPAMFRRVTFAAMEREPKPILTDFGISRGGGYGTVVEAPKSMQDSGIYIGGALLYAGDWDNPEWVKRWILDQMESQGVRLG